MNTEPFKSCDECGGECCKGFAVPLAFDKQIKTVGVPFGIYESKNDFNPDRYFLLHEGISRSFDNRRFIVDENIETEHVQTEKGIQIFVKSRCTRLCREGKCKIYHIRPDMCRNFTEATLDSYIVPTRCKYLKAEQ